MHGERAALALRLVLLGKHVGYLLEHRLANRGLNRTKAMILMTLSHHPGLQAQNLCRPAGVEPANVTRTLQSLERLGLLERRPHPTDGRAHLFFLTDAGHSLARELSEEIHAISAALLEEMPADERLQLERQLETLWKAVAVSLHLSAISSRPSGRDWDQPRGLDGNRTDEPATSGHDVLSRRKLKAES